MTKSSTSPDPTSNSTDAAARITSKDDRDERSAVRDSIRSWGTYGGLGFEFAVFIILGVKGGQWLDSRFGTTYLALVGLLLGLAAGFRSLFQLARRAKAEN